jgi:hypothetical protein
MRMPAWRQNPPRSNLGSLITMSGGSGVGGVDSTTKALSTGFGQERREKKSGR